MAKRRLIKAVSVQQVLYARCGACGDIWRKDGKPIDKNTDLSKLTDKDYEIDYCGCEDRREMVQVTRDMALDVGCPEMQGHWIEW